MSERTEGTIAEEIYNLMDSFRENENKWLEKDTKAAAARARKASTDLRKLLKEWRAVNLENCKE